MRIYMISNYTDFPDEGIKNVAFNLYKNLSVAHEVRHVNARKSIFHRDFWQSLKSFNPEIIHCFLRPTCRVFPMLKAFKIYCGNTKVIMSALQPPLCSFIGKMIIPLLKPDLVLVQSYETERIFTGLGCRTAFLPNGVDTAKFSPASDRSVKNKLREKYSVDKEKFVALHVGSIKENRNLGIFNEIQSQENAQVIIIGNTTFKPETEVLASIREHGCIVWRTYFENIEEVYRLSDCYVFPAIDKSSCIEIPLSVLEAMSCNLPVVSSRFGALPRVFPDEVGGLIFADKKDDILNGFTKVRKGVQVRNRDEVLPYSWQSVTERLEKIYEELLSNSRAG